MLKNILMKCLFTTKNIIFIMLPRWVEMINYIFVIIATVLLAFEFAFSKKYQMCEGTSPVAGLKFNAIAGFFTIIIFFCLNGFKFNITFFSIVMAFFMSLCGVLYSIIGFRVLKFGNMALYSIFLMSGGMLLPYVFGVLFLDEKYSALSVHYVPKFFEFIDKFCEENDFIIVMISHIDNQIEHADKVYYLNDGVISEGEAIKEWTYLVYAME